MKLFTMLSSLLFVLVGLLNRNSPKGGTYTSSERLYLDKNGKVVREGNPDKTTLLVAAGGELSEEEARRVGLIDAEGNAVDLAAEETEQPKTQAGPQRRKTQAGPDEVKGDVLTSTPTPSQTEGAKE